LAVAVLTLRDGKTCKPGETQEIKLHLRENPLFPVEAVKRRLAACSSSNFPTLFSYAGPNGEATHLTKDSVVKTLSASWEKGGFTNLTGHSFWVGGASICYAMDIKVEEICEIGRWDSNCYQLYIRPYLEAEVKESTEILAQLDQLWLAENHQPNFAIKTEPLGE
jgi:hypothetical protein